MFHETRMCTLTMTAGRALRALRWHGRPKALPAPRAPARARHCGALAVLLLAILGAPAPAAVAASEIRPRIVGGALTFAGQWPSVVAILINRPGFSARLRQFCGGTLIDPNWVLTAAHCVIDDDGVRTDPAELSVMSGEVNLEQVDSGDETLVSNIIAHPDYVPGRFINDIALLELAQPIDGPVSALFRGNPESLVDFDSLIIGWGAFRYDGPESQSFDGQQREAVVPIVSRGTCNAPDSYNGQVIDGQFCAGFAAGGTDSCAGDSGGPLVVGFQDGDELLAVQVGVVSYGNGCALPDFYGVYTDVSAYESFIDDFVQATYLPRRPNDPGESFPDADPTGNAADTEAGDAGVVSIGSSTGGGGSPGVLWLLALTGVLLRRYRRA